MAENKDLDDLLDSALNEFQNNNYSDSRESNAPVGASSMFEGSCPVLTEDMIKEATTNFEVRLREIMRQQQGCLPTDNAEFDMKKIQTELSSIASAASKSASTSSSFSQNGATAEKEPDFQQLIADAVNQLSENTKEFQAMPSKEDFSKLLSQMTLGAEGSDEDAASLFPLMQSMLENILSKEILYPPLKEIVAKFPDWLADKESTLSESDYTRYSKQYDFMKQIVHLYESEKVSDADEVKAKRFEEIVCLMQKLQQEGDPPLELAGSLPGLDQGSSFGLTDFASMMSASADNSSATTGSTDDPCCVM